MELFKLFGTIMVDNDKANESISKTDEKAGGLGKKLLGGIGTAAKWGAGIVAGATVAIGGMVKLAEKTAEQADFVDKLSERTGINREELQRWKYACDQSGADVGKLEVGIKKLSASMDGATQGSKLNVAAFQELGISMEEVNSKSPSEMMDTVLKKLADMPDSAERNALGNKLLGKSYTDMLPLLNAGAGGIEELKNRADELGLVMSEDAVKANVKFGDTLADVKNAFGSIGMHISNMFLPMIQIVLEIILEKMPIIQSVLQVTCQIIGVAVNIVISVIKILHQAFIALFDSGGQGSIDFSVKIKAMVDFIKPLLDGLKEFINNILNLIKTIWKNHGDEITFIVRAAFNVLKEVIVSVLKIIKGIFDIWNGLLTGDWQRVWNGLSTIVKAVFDLIISLIKTWTKGVLELIEGMGRKLFQAGKDIFNKLLEGMKATWENIYSWISEKVNWLKDKLSFWRSSAAEMESARIDGSHATGLSYVPFDGYIAELHKGERVLTAEENRELSKQGGNVYVTQNIYSKVSDERAVRRDAERKLEEILKDK